LESQGVKAGNNAKGQRKLLTFADSRQGAARHAAYLQSTVESTLYRHLIARAASDLNEKGQIPDVNTAA
jgi:hypothetical protein